jgi:hypothetical protein
MKTRDVPPRELTAAEIDVVSGGGASGSPPDLVISLFGKSGQLPSLNGFLNGTGHAADTVAEKNPNVIDTRAGGQSKPPA